MVSTKIQPMPYQMFTRIVAITAFILSGIFLYGQDSLKSISSQLPSEFFGKVSAKCNSLQQKIDQKSAKVLQQMTRQEAKIIKKLYKIDSTAANNVLNTAYQRYKQLEQKLKTPGQLTQYLPKLDTLATSLKFIESNPQLLSAITDGKEKLNEALAKMDGLQNQLQKAEEVKNFLKERKQFLKDQISRLGFAKELKRLNKSVYYYSQQIAEYKETLKDSKKAESKAIELLSKSKLFQDFMKKNSMLASFFPMPGSGSDIGGQSTQATGFAALQTRAQISTFLQQAGMNSPAAMSRFQQNIQNAESQLDQLRNKISQLTGANGSDLDDLPDFKPNSQKTKSFSKRLEYGTTFQSQKATAFFPSTSDIGLSVGYKLNDKSVIGIAASYKIGLGTGWNNIKFTNQGVGLRSFLDWKIKGSFWFSGGYEQNYRTLFNSVDQLKNLDAWQQSGLLGISKTVSLKSKFFKKTKLQLLWDFLSYQQRPVTQPLLFRVGYNF